jgi:hypothetical protein
VVTMIKWHALHDIPMHYINCGDALYPCKVGSISPLLCWKNRFVALLTVNLVVIESLSLSSNLSQQVQYKRCASKPHPSSMKVILGAIWFMASLVGMVFKFTFYFQRWVLCLRLHKLWKRWIGCKYIALTGTRDMDVLYLNSDFIKFL